MDVVDGKRVLGGTEERRTLAGKSLKTGCFKSPFLPGVI